MFNTSFYNEAMKKSGLSILNLAVEPVKSKILSVLAEAPSAKDLKGWFLWET